jgi:dipeptidase D
MSREICAADKDFSVSLNNETANECFDKEFTQRLISLLNVVRTGVLGMSNHIKGLVEYSRNAGIIATGADGVVITLSSRSSVEAQLDLSCRELDMLCKIAGADCRHYARYPGWEFEPVSALREKYSAAYESLYGEKQRVGVIHAGLECGILSSKMRGMDIISVGPNMKDIHSPDEMLYLDSVERVWKALARLVADWNVLQ